jgi:hypothetical protein
MGGCLPDFAGWSGYPSIAALSINPGIDVMCQEETPGVGLRLGRDRVGAFRVIDTLARDFIMITIEPLNFLDWTNYRLLPID